MEKKPSCETVSIAEAAAQLGLNVHSVYRAARRGELSALRIGRRLLIPRRVLQRLLDGERTA